MSIGRCDSAQPRKNAKTQPRSLRQHAARRDQVAHGRPRQPGPGLQHRNRQRLVSGGIVAGAHPHKLPKVMHELGLIVILAIHCPNPAQTGIEQKIGKAAHEPLPTQQSLGREAEIALAYPLHGSLTDGGLARNIADRPGIAIDQGGVDRRNSCLAGKGQLQHSQKVPLQHREALLHAYARPMQLAGQSAKIGEGRMRVAINHLVRPFGGLQTDEFGPAQRQEADPEQLRGTYGKADRLGAWPGYGEIGWPDPLAIECFRHWHGTRVKTQVRPFRQQIIDHRFRPQELARPHDRRW